jgi:hypothetical protein
MRYHPSMSTERPPANLRTLPTLPTKTAPDKAVEWDDAARETAFELFYLAAGRSVHGLAAIIAAEPYSLPIPRQTLQDWRHRHKWDIRADERLAELAPNLRERTAANLIVAAYHASAYLASALAHGGSVDKGRSIAAKIALDAAGYSAAASAVAASLRPALPASPTPRPQRSLADLQSLADRYHRDDDDDGA